MDALLNKTTTKKEGGYTGLICTYSISVGVCIYAQERAVFAFFVKRQHYAVYNFKVFFYVRSPCPSVPAAHTETLEEHWEKNINET